MGPCLHVDNIARLVESLEAAQEGNDKLKAMAESKLINFHEDKSGIIMIGNKKFQKKMKKEMAEKPLMFCGKEMKIFQQENILVKS